MKELGTSASQPACLREAWSRPAASPPKAAPACVECGTPIGPRTKSGLCRIHARGKGHARYPRDRQCSVCGTGITRHAKSGMCKPCANRSRNSTDEFRRKVSEGQKRRMLEPEYAAMKARVAARNAQKAYLDPERREKARKLALKHLEKAFTPEAIAKKKRRIREARDAQRDKRLAWCPPEFRALHHHNVNSKRMPAAESREMIEGLILEQRAARHPYFESVVDFMRQFTAVYDRLQYGQERKRYRVGLVDLTAGELLQRAEFKGYIYPQYPRKSTLRDESLPETIAA